MSELTFQDPKKKFCEELRAAREYKGLDISRVAEKSKISQPYLEHLESGDWDFLPHAYVRAFLRTYALIVGLEVGKVLEQFDSIVDEPPVPVPGVLEGDDPEANREAVRKARQQKKKKKRERDDEPADEGRAPLKFTLAGEGGQVSRGSSGSSSSSSSTLWWIIAAVVLVIAAGFAFWPRGEKKQPVKEIPFEEVVKEHQQDVEGHPASQPENRATRTPDRSSEAPAADQGGDGEDGGAEEPESTYQQPEATPMPVDTVAQATPSDEQLELSARALAKCYIKVTVDGDTLPITDRVLDQGMSRSYTADSLFTVVLGNAAGMELKLGDTALGVLGEEGRVVTLLIGPEGIKEVHKGVLNPPEETAAPDSDTLDLTRPVGAARTAIPGTTGTQADTVKPDSAQQTPAAADTTTVDTTGGAAPDTAVQTDTSSAEDGE